MFSSVVGYRLEGILIGGHDKSISVIRVSRQNTREGHSTIEHRFGHGEACLGWMVRFEAENRYKFLCYRRQRLPWKVLLFQFREGW